MIDPQEQWCIQIETTNACTRACSNCTRMLAHVEKPFFVSVDDFAQAAQALADFPTESPPPTTVQHKVVGMIGGEPLLHPKFAELVGVMRDAVPRRRHRGLWTGLDWTTHRDAELIRETFGYINNNRHESECRHSPVLVAACDVIADPAERARAIDNCWLQRLWSSTITPKGFFFCEVAGAMDLVFGGPGGLPVEPGCWRRPLADFREQIDTWCQRCGIPLNLRGRLDHEGVDDVSHTMFTDLLMRRSPRIKAGDYVIFDPATHTTDGEPWRYLK